MKKLREWIGGIKADKLLHYIGGLTVAQVAFGALVHCLGVLLSWWIAFAGAVAVAGLKELVDKKTGGVPSWKDFVWTLAGAAIGLLIMLI